MVVKQHIRMSLKQLLMLKLLSVLLSKCQALPISLLLLIFILKLLVQLRDHQVLDQSKMVVDNVLNVTDTFV